MQPTRRAVIDVGTNSVKLLVGEVAGGEIQPVCEQSHQTRLGHGFYQTHQLQPEAIEATAKAVAEFAAKAREARAGFIRVIATSAAREASNRQELTAAIQKASDLEVEVISGEQEAEWGFQGVTTDARFAQGLLLLVDVGGGSTQFAFGRAHARPFHHSFPIGTVRLMQSTPCSDPPTRGELDHCRQWLRGFLQREVRPKLREGVGEKSIREETSNLQHPASNTQGRWFEGAQLVGAGGTASILGCMEGGLESFDRARIEAASLSAARVSWHVERLWGLPLEQRRQTIGLPRNRADVILMGVAIYEAVMTEFGFRELRLSTRGLRFAALLSSPLSTGSRH